jgi:hypothetical protein
MINEPLLDELRQLERDVVDCERRLAEQEALVVLLKRQNEDISKAQAELERMRHDQRCRQQDRQRLLSLLQP